MPTAFTSINKTLFIGDLSYFCREEHIHGLFSQFGGVDCLSIKRGKATGDCLMHGFIQMSTIEAAEEALAALNGQVFMGRRMRVTRGTEKEDTTYRDYFIQLHCSFVSRQLKKTVTEEVLYDAFLQFGDLVDVVVKRHSVAIDPPSQCGYGFIYFTSVSSALKALSVMKHFNVKGVIYDCSVSHKCANLLSYHLQEAPQERAPSRHPPSYAHQHYNSPHPSHAYSYSNNNYDNNSNNNNNNYPTHPNNHAYPYDLQTQYPPQQHPAYRPQASDPYDQYHHYDGQHHVQSVQNAHSHNHRAYDRYNNYPAPAPANTDPNALYHPAPVHNQLPRQAYYSEANVNNTSLEDMASVLSGLTTLDTTTITPRLEAYSNPPRPVSSLSSASAIHMAHSSSPLLDAQPAGNVPDLRSAALNSLAADQANEGQGEQSNGSSKKEEKSLWDMIGLEDELNRWSMSSLSSALTPTSASASSHALITEEGSKAMARDRGDTISSDQNSYKYNNSNSHDLNSMAATLLLAASPPSDSDNNSAHSNHSQNHSRPALSQPSQTNYSSLPNAPYHEYAPSNHQMMSNHRGIGYGNGNGISSSVSTTSSITTSATAATPGPHYQSPISPPPRGDYYHEHFGGPVPGSGSGHGVALPPAAPTHYPNHNQWGDVRHYHEGDAFHHKAYPSAAPSYPPYSAPSQSNNLSYQNHSLPPFARNYAA